jgi:hypothetical protein
MALFRLVHHTQDNLASRVPSCPLLVRLTCLRERKDRLNDRSNLSCIDQVANLDQLLPVRLDNKPGRARAMRLCLFSRGWAGN